MSEPDPPIANDAYASSTDRHNWSDLPLTVRSLKGGGHPSTGTACTSGIVVGRSMFLGSAAAGFRIIIEEK